MTWEWGTKHFTYGRQFGWRFQFYIWFRKLFFQPAYIQLDIEGKRTDLFWRRLSWRVIDKSPEIVDNFFKETPFSKYLKQRNPEFYNALPDIAQDTAMSSAPAEGSQHTTTITIAN